MITEFTGQALRGVPDSGALGELLRGIHGLPAIGAPVSGSDRLRHYRSLLPPDSRSEALLARHAPRLAACCAQVDASPVSPVTCHNDLIAANLRQCVH